jgi:Domain of unknown function (DUF6946)
MSNPIYIPADSPEDWRRFLADPGQWRSGFSAKELAYAWSRVGWPPEVATALASAGEALSPLFMLAGLPEHQVPLPGGSRPSPTDLLVIARNEQQELVVTAVEGKVRETFGDSVVRDWRRAKPSGGRERRLRFLGEQLGLPEPRPIDAPPDEAFESLWYQLLHRTASAVIEARRFNAQHAVMLVHSFCDQDEADGYQAFAAFARHMEIGEVPARGEVRDVPGRDPRLWLGWARSPTGAPIS